MKEFLKEFLNKYVLAFNLFRERRAQTFAAAACFYLILTSIPFLLLTARILGFFLGDLKEVGDQIISMGEQLFPEASTELLTQMSTVLNGPIFVNSKLNIVNIFILVASSLTFTNVIWNGLYLITDDRSYISKWKYLKGLVIILLSIVITMVVLVIPPLTYMLVSFVKNNPVVDFFYSNFESLKPAIEYFKNKTFTADDLISANIFPGIIFILFFTFLYRWFFNWKIGNKDALVGSLTFVVALLVGKNLFLFYFVYFRQNLLIRYGDFYTLIVALIWIFQVMVFFFYGACLCHVLKLRPLNFDFKSLRIGNHDKDTD